MVRPKLKKKLIAFLHNSNSLLENTFVNAIHSNNKAKDTQENT